jgi:hypothetical protein
MVSENGLHRGVRVGSPEDSDINLVNDPAERAGGDPKSIRKSRRAAAAPVADGMGDAPSVNPAGTAKQAKRRLEDSKKLAVQRVIYPPDDEEFECTFPQLWEGLTMSAWGDGVPRLPWTITIKRIPGAYQVKITDDDLLQYTLVDVAEWEGIRQALEMKLLSSNPGWQPMDKSYRNKKGLRKFDKKG